MLVFKSFYVSTYVCRQSVIKQRMNKWKERGKGSTSISCDKSHQAMIELRSFVTRSLPNRWLESIDELMFSIRLTNHQADCKSLRTALIPTRSSSVVSRLCVV